MKKNTQLKEIQELNPGYFATLKKVMDEQTAQYSSIISLPAWAWLWIMTGTQGFADPYDKGLSAYFEAPFQTLNIDNLIDLVHFDVTEDFAQLAKELISACNKMLEAL